MLRNMLEKIVGKEIEANKFTGKDFNTLAIVCEDMTELELREEASKELGETIAYSANLSDLLQWRESYNAGIIE